MTANDGKPLSAELWLDWIGCPSHAIAYSTLFWPEFIEYEGCVFRGLEVPSTYKEWQNKYNNSICDIECMLNHTHISDLFNSKEWAPEQILFIGKKLKEAWTAKLKIDFPDKIFQVEFDDNFDFEVDNPSITFYQKENLKNK